MFALAQIPIMPGALTTDEIIAIIGLVVSSLQALVLPVTIYLLVVQTRAMRIQTTALVEQSKEMTAQTRVFIDTIYSATFQGLYDAEAHIGELMMTYPEASRILISPKPAGAGEGAIMRLRVHSRRLILLLESVCAGLARLCWISSSISGRSRRREACPTMCGKPGKSIWAGCSVKPGCARCGRLNGAIILLDFVVLWI